MSSVNTTSKVISLKDRRKKIIRLFRGLVFDITLENLERRVFGKKYVERRSHARNRKRAQQFTDAALELGGVLIKLGQFLSSRFDLLPDVWIEELSRLQDAVPPLDFSELRPIIEADLNGRVEDLFLEFNQSPIASASLGQVHEARLLDNTRVAVKIRRPNIDSILAADLEALNRVIEFVGKRTDLGKLADLKGIAKEFEVVLMRELDYVREAESADKFRQNLKKLKYVYIPQIYRERSSQRVLTTEFIDGIKVTDFEKLDRAGIDRYKAARVLANCYLNQFMIDGFYHADPHPGNLFIRSTPTGLQVVFIDFGMIGEIDSKKRFEIRRMTVGVLQHDTEAVVDSFRELGFVRRDEDLDKIRVAVTYFIDTFLGRNLGQIRQMDKMKVFEEISYIVYSQPLFLPADFSFLARAVQTLVGICTGLSPKLDFGKESRPFMERLAAEELGSTQVFETLNNVKSFLAKVPGGDTVSAFLNSPAGEQLRDNALQLVTLPRTFNQTLDKLESGRLQVQIQSTELKQSLEKSQRSNQQLLFGILVSGLLISLVILLTSPTAPFWAILLCFFALGFMLFRLIR